MLGKLGTAAVLAFALAGPLAAQEGTPKDGGTLNVVIQPEPPGLMIGLLQNGPTQMVAGDIYESLLRYDFDLNPSPQLANPGRFPRMARHTHSSCAKASNSTMARLSPLLM